MPPSRAFNISIYLFALLLSGCGEDYTFRAQMDEAGRKADQVLVANHLCPSGRACPDGDVLFIGPHAGGMQVEIYGVQDPRITTEITQIFVSEFLNTPTMAYMRVQAFTLPHEAEVKSLFSSPSEALDVLLRRNI